jgi:hypothetical protein
MTRLASNVKTTLLHLRHRELDGVERPAARRQPGLTFFGQAAQMLFDHSIVPAGNGAGTTV